MVGGLGLGLGLGAVGGGTDGGCIEPACTVCEWFLKLIILTDSTTPGSASTLLRVLLCADVFWLFAAERSVCCELFSLSFSALAARLRGAGVGRGGSESLGIVQGAWEWRARQVEGERRKSSRGGNCQRTFVQCERCRVRGQHCSIILFPPFFTSAVRSKHDRQAGACWTAAPLASSPSRVLPSSRGMRVLLSLRARSAVAVDAGITVVDAGRDERGQSSSAGPSSTVALCRRELLLLLEAVERNELELPTAGRRARWPEDEPPLVFCARHRPLRGLALALLSSGLAAATWYALRVRSGSRACDR